MSRKGRYPKEFKLEAVRLLNEGEKPAAELAKELGVKRSLLYQWQEVLKKQGDKAFKGSGRRKSEDMSEMARLRQENKDLKEERDILKKAAAYFAKDLK